jgi:hypothetical protein
MIAGCGMVSAIMAEFCRTNLTIDIAILDSIDRTLPQAHGDRKY